MYVAREQVFLKRGNVLDKILLSRVLLHLVYVSHYADCLLY